jgi:hypothetical protein
MRRAIFVILIAFSLSMVAFALTRPDDAEASVVSVTPYSFGQTYGTSLRLLRVDLEYKILERDKDNGYILFEYTSPESGKRTVNGSIELVETKEGVHIAIQIPEMPQYHEQAILDQLKRKLSAEHGAPPNQKKKEEPKDPEGDKDQEKDKDSKEPSDADKPKKEALEED